MVPASALSDVARPASGGDHRPGAIDRHWRLALALLVFATFAIRARYFGNPLIDVDEQFYLLTGDRMLHGAIPYLDIWDRKPVGLFVLYAAIRLLGGEGVLQYQLVAAGFAAATAVMIAVIARRIAGGGAGLFAGLLYVPALAMSGGQGGQTPVFYNLAMIVAAWLVLSLVAPADDVRATPGRIRRDGTIAMLLVGVALQIKYAAVFEGLFFGITLLWIGWRTAPRRAARAIDAALWIGAALLPTALAYGWYVAIGAGPAFLYANFTSILARGAVPVGHQYHDFRRIVVRMLVFAAPIVIGEGLVRRHGRAWRALPAGAAAHNFLLAWLAAAITGFAAFGTFFNHYALPLLPPLAILAAPTFAIAYRRIGIIVGALVASALAIAYPLDAARFERRRGDAAVARQAADVIAPRLHGGCLYIFYGDPIYYHLTHSCLPTRWVFPFHLSLQREAAALGADPLAETRRILATRPPVIVDRLTDDDEINFAAQALVRDALRRDYRLVYVSRRPVAGDPNTDEIWARRPDR